jgi:hypothetical protein
MAPVSSDGTTAERGCCTGIVDPVDTIPLLTRSDTVHADRRRTCDE